ncbi:MAG TPA: ABC transporter substrate-binding protein [Candidatus Acidoferrales bacterium]|nr:ABC transporter substrate-binding protein [Candidatus Acidoferrales bacterium]
MTLRLVATRLVALFSLLLLIGSVSPVGAATETVRIGVGAIYPSYAVFLAAKDLGYYKERDLNVEITTFRGGPAAQEALAAGSVDMCSIHPSGASLAIDKGVKEQIVALFTPPQPAGWHIMVLSGSPIKSVADLNGKTIGVTQKGSLTDFWVQRAAKNAGITVTTVPLGGGVDAGLRAKQVDAAILWPLFSYKGLVDGDLRSIINLETALRPTVSEGVAASADLIEKRPDVLRRWLAATSKAVVYMQGHESWTVDYLKKYFDESDDRVARLVYRNFIMKIRPDGAMQPAWEQDALELGAAAGVAHVLPADKVFSTAFTPIKSR